MSRDILPTTSTPHVDRQPQRQRILLAQRGGSGRRLPRVRPHAVQHATGYAPLTLRSQLVPIVSFSSQIATWVILAGIALLAATDNAILCWIGIGLVAMSALFSIVTLPVEYNASERALAWLSSSGTLRGEQLDSARTALRWAARTYLVAALSAIATTYYITSRSYPLAGTKRMKGRKTPR